MVTQKFIEKKMIMSIWIFLYLLLAAACSNEQQSASTESVAAVGVEILQAQSIEVQHQLAGRTTAYLTSDVRPQVSGIIKKRLFNEGEQVKAGQPLYQLDDKLFVAAYESAKGDVAQAEAALIAAQPKAEHYRKLLKLEAVSKQDTADAEASLKQYQAALISAQAALNTAKINLQYAVIRAPITGRIATSTYTPGALVTAEQSTALTTIQQLNPLYVDISLSSTELLRLRKQMDTGQLQALKNIPVSIILEDGSHYPQQGQLHFIGSSVDTGTGEVKLRAVVPNPDALLLPGMYVNAQLPMAINHQAILVPQTAVTRNHKGEALVKLVNSQNKVVEQLIETMGVRDNQWIVSKGLQSGDKVIIDGASQVAAGDTVKITAQKQQQMVHASTTVQSHASTVKD